MKIRNLVPVLMAVLSCGAQPQFPDTPAARQFAAWLNAFNDPEPSAFQQFSEKNFPKRPGDSDRDRDFRKQTGGFEFVKAEQSSATHFTGLVKERNSNQYARFVIDVEAAEPHLISNLGLRAIDNPNEP